MLTKAQKDEALAILHATHPNAKPALDFSSPFELLVATILSAQSTDVMVNKCTAELFPVANTPEQIAAMSEEALFPYIKRCGFFNTKGRHILETARILVTEFDSEVPADLEKLQTLPGVGRKTANVVASNAFGIPAIAVDTHVFRVSNRIGLAQAKNVEKTEEQLQKAIPRENWTQAHHWLIYHGRQICDARKPKCEICPLSHLCLYFQGGKQAAKKPSAKKAVEKIRAK
ncbi:MAG: endonuclease III [Eubacteriales bacterium]|jgi:endonuclease-3|nr:endonuclease III [Eubacteriales bacterium]